MPRTPPRQRRTVEDGRLARFVEAYGSPSRFACDLCRSMGALYIVAEQSSRCSHCLFRGSPCLLLPEHHWSSFIHPDSSYHNSKSLYDCLIKLGTTNEKRLMIDLMCFRQSYQRREITEVMEKYSNALKNMVDTNKLMITTNGWVGRTI